MNPTRCGSGGCLRRLSAEGPGHAGAMIVNTGCSALRAAPGVVGLNRLSHFSTGEGGRASRLFLSYP